MERTTTPFLEQLGAFVTSKTEELFERGDRLMADIMAKGGTAKQLGDDVLLMAATSRQIPTTVPGTLLSQNGQTFQLVDRTRKANELTPPTSPKLPAVKRSKNDSMAKDPGKVAVPHLSGPVSKQEMASGLAHGFAQFDGELTPAPSPKGTSEKGSESEVASGKTEMNAGMTAHAPELIQVQREHIFDRAGTDDNYMITAIPGPAAVKSLDDGLGSKKTGHTIVSDGAMLAGVINRFTEVKAVQNKLRSIERLNRELITLANELIDVEEDLEACEETFEHLSRFSNDA